MHGVWCLVWCRGWYLWHKALSGMGGVTFMAQLVGSLTGVAVALIGGFAVYGLVNKVSGLRLSQEEYNGADLSIHKIASTSED